MSLLDTIFFNDPWWMSLIKGVVLLVFVLLWIIMNVWFERRVLARMLQRTGPNMNGPFGWFQTIAEGVKCLLKEDFQPGHVDKWVYNLAPFLAGVCAFLGWAIMPLSGNLTIFGHMTRLQLWDAPVAVLFMLAVASMGIYGTVLAGWASSDSYSLLGSLRSSASMISYEVAMGLSLVTVFMMSGTMSMSGIVEAQRGTIALGGIDTTLPFRYWLLIPSFVIFTIAALGEANRTPFDFAECEQELVSGHITEYTGFRYALYYLGEYIALTTQSAMIATLFFGSYLTPWPLNFIEFFNNPWFGPLWFLIKSQIVMFCIIWLRGAVPRLRYDQFMKLGWKVLIPVSLLWVMAVAVVKAGVQYGWWQTQAGMIVVGIVIAALLIWAFWPEKKSAPVVAHNAPFDAFAGGYPVPPMPGQVLPEFAGVVPGETTTMKEA